MPIITARPPTSVLLGHVERGGSGRGRTGDNASLLHGGELSLGNSKVMGIQAVGFGKNGGSRVCEEMVARRRSCKTIGGEDIRNLREEVGDALWGGEEVGMEKRGWWR